MLKMIKTYHFSYIPVGLSGVISKFRKFVFCLGPLKGEKEKNENRFCKILSCQQAYFFVFDLNYVCFFDETMDEKKFTC